ncbi:MAG: general stress protein [bacterium]|nr:general stress protein [bacterium]
MAQTMVAMFANQQDVEDAINQLKSLNYDPKELSIVMKDVHKVEEIEENTGTKVVAGAVSGGITGGVLLGLAGLLVGIGAIAIPGLGGVLVAGPVASALGLTGAAATATTGAVTGAIAGGLLGGLMSLGFSKDDAAMYEEKIKAGGILLAVPTIDERTNEVRDVLSSHHATDVRQLSIN